MYTGTYPEHHRLNQKAREFYLQRLRYGNDEYDTFDPTEILNLDANESTDKLVLGHEIEAYFKIDDFAKSRELLRKYFNHHGIVNKFLVFYLGTFAGKKVVNCVRKIIWS